MTLRSRYSKYRTMWIFVFFDLPTETKHQRKEAAQFRKRLLENGFTMFQFSFYIRHCDSMEHALVHARRVERLLPDEGKVGVMTVTDKQFGDIKLFIRGYSNTPLRRDIRQLELF